MLPLHLKDESKCPLEFLDRVHSLQATSHFSLKEGEEKATCYDHLRISNVHCAYLIGICIVCMFVPISFVSFGYCTHKLPCFRDARYIQRREIYFSRKLSESGTRCRLLESLENSDFFPLSTWEAWKDAPPYTD